MSPPAPAKKDPELKPFADKLKSLRGALSQEEAAHRAGISRATWQNAELQVRRPWTKNLRSIAKAFGGKNWEELHEELFRLSHGMPEPITRLSDEELDRLATRLAPILAEEMNRLQQRRK